MKIDIIERDGYTVSQRLERILNEKLEKLAKYFDDEVNVKVVCLKVAKQEKLEITVTSKGLLYRSEVTSDNMYNNIDYALPKLEKQIVRNKQKKIKALIMPFAGMLIVGAIVLLGALLLVSYSKGGEEMFKTEYIGSRPLFDTDALLANEIFAFVTLILIICAAYFITFRKKKLLIVVVALEFIASACFSFGTPAIMGIEETIYRNTRKKHQQKHKKYNENKPKQKLNFKLYFAAKYYLPVY